MATNTGNSVVNRGAYSVLTVPTCWSWWVVMTLGGLRLLSALTRYSQRNGDIVGNEV